MNCKTRGQKIDEALTTVKVWTVRVLLIAWAFVTFGGGIALGWTMRENEKLKEELIKVESEYSDFQEHMEAIYVFKR